MKIRIASTLLALALPLVAQEPAAAPQVEATFYKAYYLEKGKRDFDGAMALYSSFLAAAPTHKLAGEAAKQQFRLLDRTGKTKERDAFKEKYAKLLANVGTTTARPARGADAGGDRPERGARGEGGARPERGARGEGARGQRGGRRGGGIFGLLRNETKVADMTKEQIEELKTGIESSSAMIERFRDRMPEVAAKLEKGTAALKKALDGDDKAAAQKALDGLKEAMSGMLGGRGGRGGEQGGGRGGRGGNRQGGGGGRQGGGGGGTGAGGGGGGGR